MNEDLPSINDFIEDKSNLPSIHESIDEDLPSYKDFLEKKEEVVEEEVLVEEVVPQQTVVHEQTIIREVQDNSAIISLIEQVRDSIPEVKTYDKELFDLVNLIEEVRSEIPVVPEPPVIPEIPEVKYYDEEIETLREEVKSVSERDIPDFRWITKGFTSIDEDIDTVNTSLAELKGRLDMEIRDLVESIDVNKFESSVETKSLSEKYESVDGKVDSVKQNLIETLDDVKSKIYKEIRSTSLRIWELRNEIKEDDKSFKKELGQQYKQLGETISEIIETGEQNYSDLTNYLNGIKREISDLPEVKYYDEDIKEVNKSVSHVKNLVNELENKLNKKIKGLKESILVNPPENNTDPLTPLDQNFATLDDLSNHYRLFINRIQTQLATLGGGGETRLEFLDDIDRDTVLVDGKVIAYQASTGKFIGVTNSGGGGGGGIANTSDVRDAIQGYYGYTTDYYTVGVANTTQEVGAGETTMIMPQVAAVYQYMPTVMSGVNTNPYVGTGATIGTGQTEFSLAGLGSGASCIVRTALAFNPDDDNTNLDVQLKFTTNTATQAGGLTNFTIKKEQALIMNEGADQQYISENLFSFFVGDTLQGTTHSNAGSFSVEVVPSSDGELEVLAVTVNVVA